jgi:gluconate 2-dehydrogenase gamma chain
MTNAAEWRIVGVPVDPDATDRLFFTEHEWNTVEAATARIIPTDHDPGALEAEVVRFIDRFLSGIGFIYAAANGSGFLEISGKRADAWRARIFEMQTLYREGLRELDGEARALCGSKLVELNDDEQDQVLKQVAGPPPSGPANLEGWTSSEVRGASGVSFFFSVLVAHTRQGFYSDPIYGGNRNFVGWSVIGFPGPRSPKHTMDGTYSIKDYYVQDYDWNDLIPQLRRVQAAS